MTRELEWTAHNCLERRSYDSQVWKLIVLFLLTYCSSSGGSHVIEGLRLFHLNVDDMKTSEREERKKNHGRHESPHNHNNLTVQHSSPSPQKIKLHILPNSQYLPAS